MYILGPFPERHDGNRYILVFSDYNMCWPETVALLATKAPHIAQVLRDEILARHGAPRALLSDHSPNFLAPIVRELCNLMNTHRKLTTPYRPQADGLVERFNATLAEGLTHKLRRRRVVSLSTAQLHISVNTKFMKE